MLLRESSFFNINTNSRDSSGRTSLHYAVIKNNVDLAATLLKYNVDAGVRDSSHLTASNLATKLRGPCAPELVDLLSVKESGMAYVQSDPAAILTDSIESEASKLKLITATDRLMSLMKALTPRIYLRLLCGRLECPLSRALNWLVVR
jgi:ankyrin repeat protein